MAYFQFFLITNKKDQQLLQNH